MKYLLDSNIIISIALGSNERLRAFVSACDEGDMAMSAIVYAEVIYGSFRDKPPILSMLQSLTQEIIVLPFDEKAAQCYAMLPFKRRSYDRLIAAHALSLDLVLITDNEADFADVPGLQVENWTV